MIDGITTEIVKSVFVEVFKGGLMELRKSISWSAIKGREDEYLGSAARAYSEKFNDRYNLIRIIGMDQPVALRDIFVRVNVLEKITSHQRMSIEELEQSFDKDRRGFGRTVESKAGIELVRTTNYLVTQGIMDQLKKMKVPDGMLNRLGRPSSVPTKGRENFENFLRSKIGDSHFHEYGGSVIRMAKQRQKFIVLGKPGSGKTTFLKYIGLQALDGGLDQNRIPIFVSLKGLSDSQNDLLDYMKVEFDTCGFEDPGPFIERILTQGKAAILLDGLDEVKKEMQEKIIKDLRDFSDKYDDNIFVISCRIAAYNYVFEQFTDVEIADFDEGQVQSFIVNWFKPDRARAVSCIEALEQNVPIKELGTLPLLLTLVCLAYEASLKFPKNKSELYSEALEALLKKWDSSRGIARDETYRGLSVKRKEGLLSRIAADTFEKSDYFIKEKRLERLIASYLEHLPNADHTSLDLDGLVILKSIESQHGLLVERARSIYSFSHLTFQEYYMARHISESTKLELIDSLVKSHLTDEGWREVFLLTAEMLDDGESLFKCMKMEIDLLAIDPGVRLVLEPLQGTLQ